MSWLSRQWQQIERFWLGPADARIYALLRISFAGAALLNLVLLWPHRIEVFGRSGMMDYSVWQNSIEHLHYYSMFSLVTSDTGITLYLLLSGAAMLSLALGYRTRTAAIFVCLFQLSCSNRAFLMVHGWDTLLRVTALTLTISPIAATWSLDARRARRLTSPTREQPPPVIEVPRHGIVLLQIQVFIIYWSTVWMKLGDPFWRSGDAMAFYYMSMYSRIPSEWFAEQLFLSQVSTYFALLGEMWLPLLLASSRWRLLGFAIGIALHTTIAIVSPLTVFSWAMLTLYLAFLKPKDFDELRRLRRYLAHRSRTAVPRHLW